MNEELRFDACDVEFENFSLVFQALTEYGYWAWFYPEIVEIYDKDIIHSHSDDRLEGVQGRESKGSESTPECKAVHVWDGTNVDSDYIWIRWGCRCSFLTTFTKLVS